MAEAILEKISRMGTPVCLFRSFAQGRIQSVYLPHGTVVGRIGRDDIDLVGVMPDTVEDCFSQRTVATAKLVVPATGIILGTEDC